jgi:hypothetical protein
MSHVAEIKRVNDFFNSSKDITQKITIALLVLVMVVAISATIVYYVRDYQVWVLISWIIIGIGWLIEHGKTPERQGSKERYVEWLSTLDVPTLTKMATSPELDRHSQHHVVSYLNSNKAGWSLDN